MLILTSAVKLDNVRALICPLRRARRESVSEYGMAVFPLGLPSADKYECTAVVTIFYVNNDIVRTLSILVVI